MLTNEKVLAVFGEYLEQDPDYEVVLTSRGYTLMAWENRRGEWFSAQYCGTPEVLRDALLKAYANYWEDVITEHGRRDLTEAEGKKIREKQEALMKKCHEQ